MSLGRNLLRGLMGKKPPVPTTVPAHQGTRGNASSWHTTDPATAATYGDVAPTQVPLGRSLSLDAGGVNHTDIPVSAIKNKKIRRYLERNKYSGLPENKSLARYSSDDIAEAAEQLGFNSVEFRNLIDGLDYMDNVGPSTVYRTLSPKQ